MDKCETCLWYVYDEEYDDYLCDMDLDEDELAPGAVPTGGPATSISPPGNSEEGSTRRVLPLLHIVSIFFLPGALDFFRRREYDASLRVKLHKRNG